MGQLRFIVPQPERITADVMQRAYLAGMDCIPWLSTATWDEDWWVIERDIRESGNVYVPWEVDGHGELMLCTTSLMERKQPYHLPVELARGTLNRCRNQAANWSLSGLPLSPEFVAKQRAAMSRFALAALAQEEPLLAAQEADAAIGLTLDAMRLLTNDFVRFMQAARRGQTATSVTLLATTLESERLSGRVSRRLPMAFNSAQVSTCWRKLEPEAGHYQWEELDRQIMWCREHDMKVIGGPLLKLDAANLPDWLYLWSDDFEMLQSHLIQYVTNVVKHLHGKVHVWHAIARPNVLDTLNLSEEQRLRLTVDVIEAIRRADQRVPIVVSIDQPWGEFLAREETELSPIHFADTLVRSELGLAGIGLEINFGYWPSGTQLRDPVEICRQLDQWTGLGLPLLVFLTIPSGTGPEEKAHHVADPLPLPTHLGPSPGSQRELVELLIPLLLSHSAVQGVVWNQTRDDITHDFPHGGLFDLRKRPKPAFEGLVQWKQTYLQ